MNKIDMTQVIMVAKDNKEVTWEQIGEAVGMSPVFVTSACLGQNSLSAEHAKKLCQFLDLGTEVEFALEKYPTKTWDESVPKDPLIYRLYEVVGVYGPTLKEVIQEKFGDGIMSAIDFSMDVDKQEDPKGDRVVLTLNGKFLPYKSW